METAKLLTAFEHCPRKAFWARDWDYGKISLTDLLQIGIREGVTSHRSDFNEAAGESVIGTAAERQIISDQHNIYDQCFHYASIADIVSSAIRKPSDKPWLIAEPQSLPNGQTWHSGAYVSSDGRFLRRVALSSNWSDDKHYSFARSWYSLAEVCVFGLPMQQATIILGQERGGKRHGYWSHGLRHPVSKQLRFRKKGDKATPFKASWTEIWREDFDEISTGEWLSAMLNDGVLPDVCFSVEIPVPEKSAMQRIVDLAAYRLDEIYSANTLPPQQLSTCDWPTACNHRNHCHKNDPPSGRYGFVRVDQVSAK